MVNSGKVMLESAHQLISGAAKRVGFDQQFVDRITMAERILEFSLPIQKDDGTVKVYKGYRSQHSSLRGPYKGGIRFHPNVTREEVEALSLLMTVKTAVANIPMGGGKGGIIVDPKSLSENELKRLSRIYAEKLAPFMGEDIDIPAPDVNTNSKIMKWMLDAYESKKGKKERAAFTGKSVDHGGSLGREEATGYGGVIALEELLSRLQTNKQSPLTIAIQGFGNVGYFFSEAASQRGHHIVSVSDSKGGIYSQTGESLDVKMVLECKKEQGSIAGCYCSGGVCDSRKGKQITNEELLTLPVDILVPAALEGVITSNNMKDIKAKIIVEMANGPITEEAREYLTHKNILILPDVLANSGGVIVSYLEWVQGKQGYWWSKEEVLKKLELLMQTAFSDVWTRSQEEHIDMKSSAFEVALQRLAVYL